MRKYLNIIDTNMLCTLGPLEALVLGGKTPAPNGKVMAVLIC